MQQGMGELAQNRGEAPLPPVDVRDFLLATDDRLAAWWCEETDRRAATQTDNPFSLKTGKQLDAERADAQKKVARLERDEEKADKAVVDATRALRSHRGY